MKLALFLYCRGSANPAVRAFALDHLNDVLVNSAGLAGEGGLGAGSTRLGAFLAGSGRSPAVAHSWDDTMACWRATRGICCFRAKHAQASACNA
jgi:hypothetical protein